MPGKCKGPEVGTHRQSTISSKKGGVENAIKAWASEQSCMA